MSGAGRRRSSRSSGSPPTARVRAPEGGRRLAAGACSAAPSCWVVPNPSGLERARHGRDARDRVRGPRPCCGGHLVTDRYTADEVRAAEAPLLAAGVPLMRMAATALAREMRALAPQRILVLAGSGDNGETRSTRPRSSPPRASRSTCGAVGSRMHEAALAAAIDAGCSAGRRTDRRRPRARRHPGYRRSSHRCAGAARDAVLRLLELDPHPRVVAVDLPSGVHPDDGSADDAVLPADLTVTFGAMKRGLVLEPGPHARRTDRRRRPRLAALDTRSAERRLDVLQRSTPAASRCSPHRAGSGW